MTPRLTTGIWVSALVRRVFLGGGFAAIERRGAHEAGSVFIVGRLRDGSLELYEPAPQSSYQPEQGRAFMRSERVVDEQTLAVRLESEVRFDSDIWIVELEPGTETIANLIELAV